MSRIRVAGAQINLKVGDLAGNRALILDAMAWAESAGADLLVLPETAIAGYPIEDLALRPAFVADCARIEQELAARAGRVTSVVGLPRAVDPRRVEDAVARTALSSAGLLRDGTVLGHFDKIALPNYGVFDEQRLFAAGTRADLTWEVAGQRVGVVICEDIWVPEDGPADRQVAAGARLIVVPNGSPYHRGKPEQRLEVVRAAARRLGVPVFYLNLVGGQDELVFDGGSIVVDGTGRLVHRSPMFVEDRFVVDLDLDRPGQTVGTVCPEPEPEAQVYRALCLGLADYVAKNGFPEVVIGLSGGIDSALTAAIAADALGAGRVRGVEMPGPYSSPGSLADADDLAARLGIRLHRLPITPVYETFLDVLAPAFAGAAPNIAEENLQARARGAVLMALSNKFGGLVVSTGNKSEMSVGYATLYGDMCGGFNALKDVTKSWVYRLARWRNRQSEVIPAASLEKPPSAELAPDQKDEDSLPPYSVLDPILEYYVEQGMGVAEIAAAGYDEATVRRVVKMVDRAEYKRRQAPPGPKVTPLAFGRDRRMPITNGYVQ